MKAIIVAGGKGERLKPLTSNIPKPMIKVDGKPILLHIIELFKKNGIKEFVIALCYLPDVITIFFGNGKKFGVKIKYTYEDPKKPLGTAGAISLARDLVKDTFIVTYADILRQLDIKKMINQHKKNNAFATINVYKRESKEAKSLVVIDKKKMIVKFIERPKLSDLIDEYIWVNGSFYIFEKEIFDFITNNKKLDFGSDIFPKLLKLKKEISAYPTNGYFVDIGNIEKLKLARKTLNRVDKSNKALSILAGVKKLKDAKLMPGRIQQTV